MGDISEDDGASKETLELIARRAVAIERRLRGDPPDLTDPVERVKEHCLRVGATSVRYKWVPPNYYDTTLEERAREIGCLPEQLCKTMVMENKACDEKDPPTERFYLVVVQYTARLSSQKISSAVMRLKPASGGGDRSSRGRCNLQVASEEVGLSLSGFPHNGVTVFGGLTPMPVILSEAVLGLRPAFVWMGSGHPLLKLGVSARDLVTKLGAVSADISIPRDGGFAATDEADTIDS
ncbi:unnamed protein product [Scytosiphon promiscuus]